MIFVGKVLCVVFVVKIIFSETEGIAKIADLTIDYRHTHGIGNLLRCHKIRLKSDLQVSFIAKKDHYCTK